MSRNRGRRADLARAARHLRVRVTAAATLAAVVFAVAGAAVFVVLFDQALLGNTDAALVTVTTQLAPDLAGSNAQPALAPATPHYRTTAIQLIDPHGVLRQTVTSSRGLDPTAAGRRSTLATPTQVAAGQRGTVLFTVGGARVVLTPVVRPDGPWVLLAATDLEQVDDAAHDAKAAFFLVVPIVVLAIAVGAWFLSGAVLRPVERIRGDAAELLRGVSDGRGATPGGQVRVPDSGDEIESLALTLNNLLAQLEAAASRQRELIADAGHELRTPLTVLRTELELADRPTRTREQLLDAVRHAAIEVDRLTALANDLLMLAGADRRTTRVAEREDVGAIVLEAVRAHRSLAEQRGVKLTVHIETAGLSDEFDTDSGGGSTMARIDRDACRRVIDNLLGNAIGVGARTVSTTVGRSGVGLTVTVEDDGPGFEPEFLPQAFDRFTRADSSRHRTGPGGAGLGLAIVTAVAAAHGGQADAVNTGHGARVTVTLPN